jgi:hypothetical protein
MKQKPPEREAFFIKRPLPGALKNRSVEHTQSNNMFQNFQPILYCCCFFLDKVRISTVKPDFNV